MADRINVADEIRAIEVQEGSTIWPYLFLFMVVVTNTLGIWLCVTEINNAYPLMAFYIPFVISASSTMVIGLSVQAFLKWFPGESQPYINFLSPISCLLVGGSIGILGSTWQNYALAVAAIVIFVYTFVKNLLTGESNYENAEEMIEWARVSYSNVQRALIFGSVTTVTVYSCWLMLGAGAVIGNADWQKWVILVVLRISLGYTVLVLKSIVYIIMFDDCIEHLKGNNPRLMDVVPRILRVFKHILIGTAVIFCLHMVNLISMNKLKNWTARVGDQLGFPQLRYFEEGLLLIQKGRYEKFTQPGMARVIDPDTIDTICHQAGIITGMFGSLIAVVLTATNESPYLNDMVLFTFIGGYTMSRISTAYISASTTAYLLQFAFNQHNPRLGAALPGVLMKLTL